MSLHQIPQQEIDRNAVASLPDRMTGTAAENKAAFDALVKCAISYYNAAIATLTGADGAAALGAAPFEGVDGTTIQAQLECLQTNIKNVTAGSVPAGSIDTAKLADGAVAAAKLAKAAVTAASIASDAVTADAIADDAVTTDAIADGALTSNHFGVKSVPSTALADAAVLTAALANLAVTAAKLANGAVTTDKLASSAVTGAKIANSTIPAGKLSFTAAQYAVGVYTGNGESGYGEKNSLTFPFVPKCVLIVDETYGAMNYGSVCWMGQNFGASQVQFSLSGKTLSWYTTYDDSPQYQMNTFGDKYTYLAIG